MSSLTQDFHFNSDNSHARMSLRKTAELLKVSVKAISNAIRRVNLDFTETAENLVQYGIDGVNLAVLVEYYATINKVFFNYADCFTRNPQMTQYENHSNLYRLLYTAITCTSEDLYVFTRR